MPAKDTTTSEPRRRQTKRNAPPRIQLEDDELVLDEIFLAEVLAGATQRTGIRLDRQGCPFILINGIKYRPLREGRRWLAARIKRNTPRTPLVKRRR